MPKISVKQKLTGINVFRDITYYYRIISKCILSGFVPHETVSGYSELFPELHGLLEYSEFLHKGKLIRKQDLGLPNTISSYIRKNMYAEPPEISFEKENAAALEFILEVLDDNKWKTKEPRSFELQLHIGDRIIKPYIKNGKMKLQFLRGDQFVATRIEDGEVISGVFISYKEIKEKNVTTTYTRLEWHYAADEETPGAIGRKIKIEMYKTTEIKNHFKTLCTNQIHQIFGDNIDNLEQEIPGLDIPTFVIIKNPDVNNKDLDDPRGLGMFINALSPIMVANNAFNGVNTDIVWGGMQKLVPEIATEEIITKQGSTYKHHNPADPQIMVYASNELTDAKPEAYAPQLRTEQQIPVINMAMDVTSVKVGIDAGTLRFDGKSIATATQVITEKSDTARTIKDLEENSTNGFLDLFILMKEYANRFLGKTLSFKKQDIKVTWHDNVIVDDAAAREEDRTHVQGKYKSREQYWIDNYGLDPKKAKQLVIAAQTEQDMLDRMTYATVEELDESDPDGTNEDQDDNEDNNDDE